MTPLPRFFDAFWCRWRVTRWFLPMCRLHHRWMCSADQPSSQVSTTPPLNVLCWPTVESSVDYTIAECALLTNRRVDFNVVTLVVSAKFWSRCTLTHCGLTRPQTLPPVAVESLSMLPPPPIPVDSRDHGRCSRSPLNPCRIHSADLVTKLLSTSP